MDVKDLLISVSEPHSTMTNTHISVITNVLVKKMRENMKTMMSNFLFEDDKERQMFIERVLFVYEMGIKDGLNEWLKTNKET